MTTSLDTFVAHARKKGMDHATIRLLLLSNGWKEKDISHALAAESLDMAVPAPPDAGGARDAFFHLLTFACLYTTLVSLTYLFFRYINLLFPDPATQPYVDYGDDSSVRWFVAAVLVTFPLFLWTSRLLLKEMQEHHEKAQSGVRRWLTYLTLFIAACVLLGDGVTLVFNLLGGELSVRFLLKVLVVLLLTGLTFAYYFLSLRQIKQKGFHRSFAIGASLVVIVAVVWGFVLSGSPGTQRAMRFDERRVEDLRAIQTAMMTYVYAGRPYDTPATLPVHPVPATLSDLQKETLYQKLNLFDPENGDQYEYHVRSETQYQLCAFFGLPRDQEYDSFWNHPAGRHCYSLDVTNLTIR